MIELHVAGKGKHHTQDGWGFGFGWGRGRGKDGGQGLESAFCMLNDYLSLTNLEEMNFQMAGNSAD